MDVGWIHRAWDWESGGFSWKRQWIFHSYNKSQRDALFLKFILIKCSTCFGQVHFPSSGVSQHCIDAIGICHASYVECLLADSQHNQHDRYQLLCIIQWWDSWWGTVNLSETCRVLYQNKLEKQYISLAFIIRIYHDARSSECQTNIRVVQNMGNILTIMWNILLSRRTHFHVVSSVY